MTFHGDTLDTHFEVVKTTTSVIWMELGRSDLAKEFDLEPGFAYEINFALFVIAIRVLEISFELTIAARSGKWPRRARPPGAQN